jgi:glutamine amidotransferase-like uncharacterized protein
LSKTIALFIHQPKCSIQSGNGIMNALKEHYNFKVFTKHELEDDFFNNVDAVCFPGGIGDADSYDYLFQSNGRVIRDFVQRGGKYLGVCMGAYWAGTEYFNLLTDVEPQQYIKRPNTDTHRPHAKNIDVVWKDTQQKMFFYDGCALIGNEKKFETIARYSNGDPMAIIQDNVGLIGCHPESEPHWYKSYSWMRGLWHDGKHHRQLLEFVDELMEQK